MSIGTRIDFRRELRQLYSASVRDVAIVDVPELHYLMIDGAGDPNAAPAWQEAVQALFTASYTLRQLARSSAGVDYVVLPLEGLWWVGDNTSFDVERKGDWRWTAMIMQPPAVTDELWQDAQQSLTARDDLAALGMLRLAALREGRAAQIMHRGPFSTEGPTVARLHAAIEDHGGRLSGKHHEIYLSDFRRSAPENRKTIVRQPFT